MEGASGGSDPLDGEEAAVSRRRRPPRFRTRAARSPLYGPANEVRLETVEDW